MPAAHVVLPGEHISSIAGEHGFGDHRTVWLDPQNAELRSLRPDPHVLAPGDVVHIPDKVAESRLAPTGARHFFALTGPSLQLRLRLQDLRGEDLPDRPVTLDLEHRSDELRTDGRGVVSRRIQPTTRGGTFRADGRDHPLIIGGLVPVTEREGLLARLSNLGYDADDLNPEDDDDLRFVIACFQRDHGLPVTGEPADAEAPLLERHGK